MTKLSAILCDMDGTLVDSEPLQEHAWHNALAQAGAKVEPDWAVKWRGRDDKTAAGAVVAAQPELGDPQALIELKNSLYRGILKANDPKFPLRCYPDIKPRLEKLSTGNIPMAVVTNNNRRDVGLTLDVSSLAKFFQFMVTIEDAPKGKPDPTLFLLAAKRIGSPPERCLVIEDSPAGVAAGKAAGCLVAAVVTTHKAEQLAQADRVFASPALALDWAVELFIGE